MSLGKRAVITAVVVIMFVVTSLSGCIGPGEIYTKLAEKIEEEREYEWDTRLEDEKTFKIIDVLNKNFAKVEDYPPINVKGGTKYLHVFIDVNFSNVINPLWTCFTIGHVEITITDPSGTNTSRKYSALESGDRYKDFFYFAEPQRGDWNVTLKVRGMGHYRLFAETYHHKAAVA